MAIHRINHDKDYTVMANYHFKDYELSWKAKGILSLMLSFKDDWKFSYKGLSVLAGDSIDSLKSGLNELKRKGYLNIKKSYPKVGSQRITYEWDVYEKPQGVDFQHLEKQASENQPLDNQHLEKQASENPTQLNTNISNTKELNTKVLSTNNKSRPSKASSNYIDSIEFYDGEKLPWED